MLFKLRLTLFWYRKRNVKKKKKKERKLKENFFRNFINENNIKLCGFPVVTQLNNKTVLEL